MTPHLKLPLLAAGQAQKHVTMNEALAALDTLSQLSVINRTQVAPPEDPAIGAAYIVAASPTGAFAGHAGDIATHDEAGWRFHEPADGWCCYVRSEDLLLVRAAGTWKAAAMPASPTIVGIGATADPHNRLAVRSPASLFDHAGAGHQLKINKASAAHTAGILLQTAYGGRAELGLAGDDRFRIKVSPDGSAWKDGLVVDPATGLVQVGGPPVATNGVATKGSVEAYAAPFDYQPSQNQQIADGGAWTRIIGLTVPRIASNAFDTAASTFIAPVAGTYAFTAQVVHTAGTSGTVLTAAATRNGTPAGNRASHGIAANTQGTLVLVTLLALAANDAVGLAVAARGTTTISASLTAFHGHRL